jgi:hypothetical protein
MSCLQLYVCKMCSFVRKDFARQVKVQISASCGGLLHKPLYWSLPGCGRCDTSRVFSRARNSFSFYHRQKTNQVLPKTLTFSVSSSVFTFAVHFGPGHFSPPYLTQIVLLIFIPCCMIERPKSRFFYGSCNFVTCYISSCLVKLN